MAEPDLLPGNRFRLLREGAVAGTYVFVCLATTITFNRTSQFEDTTVNDCDAPLSIPTRKSMVQSTAWNLNFSGAVDAKRLAVIEADVGVETPHSYQLIMDKAAADGGRTYTGDIFIETLEIAKQDNGLVRFTAQARGNGALVVEPLA